MTHRRTMAATVAALAALFVVALPVSADSEYAGAQTSIDWRLVAVLVLVGLFAFYAVLQLLNRDR